MNNPLHPSQSNTRFGYLQILVAAASLAGAEGLLTHLSATGLAVPTAAADLSLYLVVEGDVAGGQATVQPLSPMINCRIRAQGAGSKGDVLVLATGADFGKVSTFAAQTGVLFSPGIAEEDYVDDQLVLVRPMPRYLTGVATPFSGATPAATASALTSYGFAQVQADALIATVRDMRAALIAKGLMA